MKFVERLYTRLKDYEVVKDADFRVLELWHESVMHWYEVTTVRDKSKHIIGVILTQI